MAETLLPLPSRTSTIRNAGPTFSLATSFRASCLGLADGSEFNYHASQAILRVGAVLVVLFLGERTHVYHAIGVAPIVAVIVLGSPTLRPV